MAYFRRFCYNLTIGTICGKKVAALTEFEIILLQKLEEKDQLILSMQAANSTLQASVDTMSSTIDELNKTIAELNQTIAALKEQLHKNSNNSSKPPSSDGYRKPPVPKSLRSKSGKKSGGQEGHEGTNLAQAKPDHVIPCMPAKCAHCPRHDECLAKAKVLDNRQVFDAVVKIDVTEYDRMRVVNCPLHGWTREGSFPEGINAAVQYGENLQSLVVALNTVGAVSICRTREILSNVFNIPLSEGTVTSMVSRCAGKLPDVIAKIGRLVTGSVVDNADETGFRVEGKLHWAHVLCNGVFTLITLSDKRGWPGMQEIGFLPKFHGILVHDCWAPYWKCPGVTHAVCCAHLLRELTGIEENNPGFTWPKEFKQLLLEMKEVRDRAFESGKQGLSYYYHHKFSIMYDRIIAKAYQETPEPIPKPGKKKRGRKPRGKALSLVDRLNALKGAVCLFTKNFLVPFDNNQAERDLRMIKAKTKVAGCFRTKKGAQEYLDIMSYASTAKKLGSNAYEAIRNAVTGTPDYIFTGGAE